MDKYWVSVCMITYNHAEFIAEAIEGVLLQKTKFPYELVIGEDCSTDLTREICLEYQRKYPDVIRVLTHEENIGMMPNFVQTLQACQGKYIALCEGDDYWTDPQKLQKQVDFLESKQEFSICFHKVKILENGILKDDYITKVPSTVTTIDDLARGNYIHTPSCVFRNRIEETIGEHIYESAIGDYYLHMMNAQYGDIFYMDEEMAIYREHGDSYWSGLSKAKRQEKTCFTLLAIMHDLNYSLKESRRRLIAQFFRHLTGYTGQKGYCTKTVDSLLEQLACFGSDLTLHAFEKEKELIKCKAIDRQNDKKLTVKRVSRQLLKLIRRSPI